MTIYNAAVKVDDKIEIYSIKTACQSQFNVPERQRVINELKKRYGSVIRIQETDSPMTLIGLIEI